MYLCKLICRSVHTNPLRRQGAQAQLVRTSVFRCNIIVCGSNEDLFALTSHDRLFEIAVSGVAGTNKQVTFIYAVETKVEYLQSLTFRHCTGRGFQSPMLCAIYCAQTDNSLYVSCALVRSLYLYGGGTSAPETPLVR